MKKFLFFLIIGLLTSCASSKPDTVTRQLFQTEDPVTEQAKIVMAMVSTTEPSDAKVEITYGLTPIVYTEPCFEVITQPASMPAAAAELNRMEIKCLELQGSWLAAHVFVLTSTNDVEQWTICPALIRPSAQLGDIIHVTRKNVRISPNSYGESILVQED